jgi:hypothetical protein
MTDELIAKLEAWKEYNFHADRQLSDEILIADGWQCEPDDTFEGGIRWWRGPYSTGESCRPHPIHDLNAAIALVPFKMDWRVSRITGGHLSAKPGPRFECEISDYNQRIKRVIGVSSEATVAVCIAALKAIHAIKFPPPTET